MTLCLAQSQHPSKTAAEEDCDAVIALEALPVQETEHG